MEAIFPVFIIVLFFIGFFGQMTSNSNRKTSRHDPYKDNIMPMDYVVYEEILHSQYENDNEDGV